jgi:predicted ATPase
MTLALVQDRLGVTRLPAEVSELLLDRGDGNPFFTEELAYTLRDSGVIVIDGGQARSASQTSLRGRRPRQHRARRHHRPHRPAASF